MSDGIYGIIEPDGIKFFTSRDRAVAYFQERIGDCDIDMFVLAAPAKDGSDYFTPSAPWPDFFNAALKGGAG